MNATAIPASLAVKPVHMVFHAVGRIEHAEKYQNNFTTLIKTPAQDAYSYPPTIAVRSKSRLGSVGDEISIKCTISGVPRTFQRKDKETGEITPARTADAYFSVVE